MTLVYLFLFFNSIQDYFFNGELETFIVRIMIPAIVTIAIKLAIITKTEKLTAFHVISSFILGVGPAYLFSDLIMNHVSHDYVTLVTAAITISGEKMGIYFMYKFNIDKLMNKILENFFKMKKD